MAYPLEITADDLAFNKVVSRSIDFFTSSISSVNGKDQKSTGFYLSQNYPSPFNPGTIISWQLSRKLSGSKVTLKIYDVLGREVVTLVNEEKPAGNYSVKFDASRLSSGMYFYRLQAGNYIQTKKMMLLK